MFIQLKVKNYRSYKEETVFSMEANSSLHKLNNIFEINNVRLVKTAIIYGSNASGKSNIIRSLFEITKFITNKPKVDEKIRLYEPFAFNSNSNRHPCEFELTFLDKNFIKYCYKFSILEKLVISEELHYYPNGKITKIFGREPYDESYRVQKGILGDSFKNKEINVFANQLILSKFGDDEPNEILTELFLYFKSYEVINATNLKHKDHLTKKVTEELFNNLELKKKVGKLIKAADTKINNIEVISSSEEEDSTINEDDTYRIYGLHDLYENEEIIGISKMLFSEESTGTRSLYILGGKILGSLERGSVLIIDELDNSLHPLITKMIVMIFHSKKVNPKNAQLIFTTHDVTLLDRDLIRRDQIWIAEKNERGSSELFSLQDFEGLREDTPFEKWYLAGKFGGLPKIKSIESIFDSNE